MLRDFRHRRQRDLVGFLSLAIVLVFALRGLVSVAPLAAFYHATANGQTALCIGSSVVAVSADGTAQHIAVDNCADCLTACAPPLFAAETQERASALALASWWTRAPASPWLRHCCSHPVRAPPLA